MRYIPPHAGKKYIGSIKLHNCMNNQCFSTWLQALALGIIAPLFSMNTYVRIFKSVMSSVYMY